MRLLVTSICALVALAPAFADPIDIGSRLEPFVDQLLIDKLDGARHMLHPPVARETAFAFDKPWEGRYSAYVTVLKDGDTYRAYYRGMPQAGSDYSDQENTSTAESTDGVHWTKPTVGLYEYNGSKDNNIVMFNNKPFSHNFAPFVDTRPGVPAEERYKATAGNVRTGLYGFVSADGYDWKQMDGPLFKGEDIKLDSQNVAFWSEHEQQYVAYFRTFENGVRSVARATSPDFKEWGNIRNMTYGDTPREHLYTNQTIAYDRAPHIYLAIAARFMPGRRVVSADMADELGGDAQYTGDCSDTVLMTSRGGYTYDRTFMEAFIRPGLGLSNWTSRTNYPARGVVQTGDGELSLYVQRNYGQDSAHLQRLTLRTDGFASIHAPYEGGSFTTKPIVFSGSELFLNMATSAAGSIWVEVLDADGQPVPGYTREDADELIGDFIERKVTWNESGDVSGLAGQPVRLKFHMKDADVYAIRFK